MITRPLFVYNRQPFSLYIIYDKRVLAHGSSLLSVTQLFTLIQQAE
jgi:hypothetical protein